MKTSFPYLHQLDSMDCGPTCLYMICRYYGRKVNIEFLREQTEIGKEGVNMLGICNAAEKIGFKTLAVKPTINELIEAAKLPAILHWGQNHFVVLYAIKKSPSFPPWVIMKGCKFYIADPGKGLLSFSQQEFEQYWVSGSVCDGKTGVTLIIEPTKVFYDQKREGSNAGHKKGFANILPYLYPYKKLIVQLCLGMLLGSMLQLVLPFMSQSVVDTGINTANLHFVYFILIGQLALFAGRLAVDFIKAWILYHISSSINIALLTDFLIKLMKLPVGYFDSKKTGDILQRINDHQRIQNFLTGTSLTTLFSVFNLIVFSIVLGMYNLPIFFVFLLAAVLYTAWVIVFLKKRKQLDYRQFEVSAAEQGKTMELIQGMQEIKLHGCEKQKRWQWEHLKAKSFKIGMKILALNQWQQTGAFFINEGKNIIITFLAAKAVIDGNLTLGAMVAIQYIIGQLNGPIEQIIGFVQSWQLAKISLDRLNEIHKLKDEENITEKLSSKIPFDHCIKIKDISFKYAGAGNENILKNIELLVPQGKVTAIVGNSGSGKTTLLKLLLKFYENYKGSISVGESNFENISHRVWRKNIGVVMQESFIFSDSIAANIAVSDDQPSINKLRDAARIANVLDFIESLPLGFYSKIGADGNGISAGQKQRILIARAIYKNPEYIFLDEATNSLDANNEMTILKNLEQFFKNRTVIVVAHRLSTVKHAHQIVVINKGIITEVGTHETLVQQRGAYYTLIKNQLEMGT